MLNPSFVTNFCEISLAIIVKIILLSVIRIKELRTVRVCSAALRPVQWSMKFQCIRALQKMNFLVSVILPEKLFPSVAALRFWHFVLIFKHNVSICHCAKVVFHPQLCLLCLAMHSHTSSSLTCIYGWQSHPFLVFVIQG